MPGVRLPQTREEIARLADELEKLAEEVVLGESYREKPGKKPRRHSTRKDGPDPRAALVSWLNELSILGALYEPELLQITGRAAVLWPEPLKELDARLVVRTILRRRWAQTDPTR